MRIKQILLFLMLVSMGCDQKKPEVKPLVPKVVTTAVQQKDVPVYIDTIGQVISPVTVNVRPQVNGKLIKTYVTQGAIVNEGDALYEVDPRPYQAILDQAISQLVHDEALLKFAQQAVTRNKKVVEEDFISKINFEQLLSNQAAAEAQVELDKAAIVSAKINLEFCKIVAPVSGKISYFNVDVGNIVVIADPNQITVIKPFSSVDILFSLPQQQFELVRSEQGDEGRWSFITTLPDRADVSFEGTTFFIDNQIGQDTGTILLKGRLSNQERKLWPGEFVRVKVLYKIAPNALLVPLSSVLIGKDGPYVYTVNEENQAVVHNVTVITRTEEYIAIQSKEINPGDIVIVDGQINVAPGIVVQPELIVK